MYYFLAKPKVLYWLKYCSIIRHLILNKTIRTLLKLFNV